MASGDELSSADNQAAGGAKSQSDDEQRAAIEAGHGPIVGLFSGLTLTSLTGPLTDQLRRDVWQRTLWSVGWPMLVFLAVGLGASVAFFYAQHLGAPSKTLIELAFLAVLFGVVALVGLTVVLFRAILVGRDLVAGEVRQSDGALVGRRNRLVTEFGGQRRWVSNPIMPSEPGPYRFYYLPRSGLILAMQPLALETVKVLFTRVQSTIGNASQDEADDTTTTRLGPVLNFDEADLAQNRNGQLSAAQGQRILRKVVVASVVWPLMAVLAYFAVFGRSQPSLLLGLALLGPVTLLLLFGPARNALNGWRDWQSGRVERVEGVVTTHMIRDPQKQAAQQQYFYAVANLTFEVPYLASEMLDNGQYYRVYYTPHGKQVVALERKRGSNE